MESKRCVFVFASLFILKIINTEAIKPVTDTPVVSINGYMDKQIKTELNGCNLKIGITGLKSCSAASPRDDVVKVKPVGSPSLTGDKGEQGPPGERGLPGLIGPPGDKGTNGPPGEIGLPGPLGSPGLKGEPGQKGEPGPIGPLGPQGPPGDRGTNGPPGEIGVPGPLGSLGPKGESGQKGEPGPIGPLGPQGPPGVKGEPGPLGPQGLPGPKGSDGSRGFPGLSGSTGLKGDTGAQGPIGPMGSPGLKGENGSKGDKGDAGAPGKDCVAEELPPPESAPKPLGSIKNPAKSCAELREDGFNYINPSNPFEVKCLITEKKTCLRIEEVDEEKIDENSITFADHAFWLSEKEFNLRKFYNLDVSNLSYLLSTSTGVSQTIRYHCLSTTVKRETDKSLQMLLWNDKLVGPDASSDTPMSYSILEDSCGDASHSWGFTDIDLRSNLNTRLPVVDFYIRDIKPGSVQKVYTELRSLCFEYTT